MPPTVPAERSPSEPRTFDAVTLSSWYVTPSMLRVRLGGADLSGFATTGVPDERLRLIFEDDTLRSYTVRRFDPAGPHLDIDFVVHDGGVAAQWAVRAQPGDRIRVSEPHGWYRPPIDTEWQLLVADMTGLPALARAVEQLPRGGTAHVIASVPSREDEQRRWCPVHSGRRCPQCRPDAPTRSTPRRGSTGTTSRPQLRSSTIFDAPCSRSSPLR
nr:siderophore-interacting protein [Rhodococcus sp. 06-1059B-a]